MNFFEKIKNAKKIIVANPGGIGDDIHLLPALDVIRRSCPGVRFDLLASDGSKAMLSAVEGVDRVFTVKWSPRFKDRSKKRSERLRALKEIFFSDYDAFVDFRPSDATQLFLLASQASARLAVSCMYWDVKRPRIYTDLVSQSWVNESSYQFMLKGLDGAGFDTSGAFMGPHLLPGSLKPNHDYSGCIHVSLCTSADCRELPISVARYLVEQLCCRYPGKKILVTGMPTEREKKIVDRVVAGLDFENLDIAVGRFNVLELLQVMLAADVHVGPDTGTVHMAWLCGTPSVSWYLNHETLTAWIPRGARHTILISSLEQSRKANQISGISADDLLDAVAVRLASDGRQLPLVGAPVMKFLVPEVDTDDPTAGANNWLGSRYDQNAGRLPISNRTTVHQ